ncbi:VaFE repeat-containing surface-anchored protein [Arsenicicoccus dermatophilus]|uniref:VaFE repeat-containing surface-anchored protein n=1 Tax=Arsenicicoccus dermatophilus TaxID=1076331 RepID=UPI0039173AC2
MSQHRLAPHVLAFALAVGVTVLTSPAATAAPGDVYEGFNVQAPRTSTGQVTHNYIYVSPSGVPQDIRGTAVYCFNVTRSVPPDVASVSTRPTFVEEAGTASNFTLLADRERLTGDALVTAVERVIYNGYGNDKAGLQATYGLTDTEFHHITQQAIWYYTDSSNSTATSGSPAMQAALANLLELDQNGSQKIPLAAPPATSGLNLFANRKNDGYQNLLSATFTPAPAAVVPAITTTARDRADADKTIAATGGVVVDTIAYTGLNVGETYTARGILRDKATGAATGLTATTTFTPTSANGSIDLAFTVPATYAGKTLVAFEQLRDVQGSIVARHEDLASAAQTITVARPTTRTISFQYQIDRWAIRTWAQRKAATKVLSLPGHIYTYRADVTMRNGRIWSAPLWQKGVASIATGTMTITIPATATPTQILALEKTALARRAGVTPGIYATPRIGHATTLATIIPAGAWGPTTPPGKGYTLKGQIQVGATTR